MLDEGYRLVFAKNRGDFDKLLGRRGGQAKSSGERAHRVECPSVYSSHHSTSAEMTTGSESTRNISKVSKKTTRSLSQSFSNSTRSVVQILCFFIGQR